MKYFAATLILIWAVTFTACVPSLQPLYTAEDVIYDESLIGAWVDTAANETWIFSKAGKGEYKLVQIADDGSMGEFRARLVRVGTETFVDMLPAGNSSVHSGFIEGHFLPTHTFVHLMKNGDRVHVAVLEPKWLKETLAEKPDLLRHEKIDGDILLTAGPKDMQAFLRSNIKTRGAFTEPLELTRRPVRCSP